MFHTAYAASTAVDSVAGEGRGGACFFSRKGHRCACDIWAARQRG